MPKISYTPKAKEGFDDAGVTALQIEQKIAEIQTLLRGMIDEDNLLAYNEDSVAVNLPPSNVLDMPAETRPVNHCMKFFGNAEQEYNVVEKLYEETIPLAETNPSFFVLNGLGDSEIVISAEGTREILQKTITVEIPFNMSPMTWGELWQYVEAINPNIGIAVNPVSSSFEDKYILFELFDMGGFLSSFNVTEDEYVTETTFNVDESHFLEYDINVVDKQNVFVTTMRVYPKDPKAGSWIYRAVPSLMCRVNP